MLMDPFLCHLMTNFSLKMYKEPAFAIRVWVFVSLRVQFPVSGLGEKK
jgi:hypothetical protein